MNNYSGLSEEMYHRLYRMIKRELDPRVISNALNIPLRTVQNVIARMSQIKFDTPVENSSDKHLSDKFLDVYFLPKTRYAILQLVGMIINDTSKTLQDELEKSV